MPGRDQRVQNEHKMMSKLVCNRHERGCTPKPDHSVLGKPCRTVRLDLSDPVFTKGFDQKPSRLLGRTGVWRPPCMKTERGWLNPQLPTDGIHEALCFDVNDGQAVEIPEQIRIHREPLNSGFMPASRTRVDTFRGELGCHGRTVSRGSDKKVDGTLIYSRQYLQDAYGLRSTVYGADLEYRRGIWFGLAAYVFWGLTPVYWNLLSTDAATLLLHRIVWSVPILALAITTRRQWPAFKGGYATWRPRIATGIAAVLLSINWGVFLWAVTNGHIVEASLGYFINPLVSVALGVVILKEQLRPLQWIAVGIAAFGVTAMGVLTGVPPWISLTLAFSFGIYGLLKKRDVTPPPLVSLFGETSVMFVPALAAMLLLAQPTGATLGSPPAVTLFFIGAGIVTVIPLLLFGSAAKQIPLSTLGFLQYIAPSIQLLVGVFVFRESMTTTELAGFTTVWIALAMFTVDRRQVSDSKRQKAAAAR
ncbi:MAG: hypothetical protein BMS9Abin12_0262 [Acidimicrobiia bacterium]|nr:MAG: hypothetical protein BMS9Abin12_0262 [Acidimicrobiia bacterium]